MTQDALIRRMFLILHDPFSGKPTVPPTLVRYGLVTAALADLLMHRRIAVENARITATGRHANGLDDVDSVILRNVLPDGADITRTWVEAFADVVYEMVARGLVTDGVVRREPGGRRLRRRVPDRFPAVDLLRAAGPRVRFDHMLRAPHDMDLVGATIAGIIHGLGMESALDVDRDRSAVQHTAAAAARQLPADLRGLLEGVTTAVAEVTLTFRRL
jgi:hypothetical protein